MDVPILILFLRPILTVTSVWNTGETGDMYNGVSKTPIEVLVKPMSALQKGGRGGQFCLKFCDVIYKCSPNKNLLTIIKKSWHSKNLRMNETKKLLNGGEYWVATQIKN